MGKYIKLYKDIQAWNSEQDKPTFGHVIDDAELVTSIVDVPYLEFNITFPPNVDPRGVATRGTLTSVNILPDDGLYGPDCTITQVLLDREEVIPNGGSSIYCDGRSIRVLSVSGQENTTHKLRLVIPRGRINGGSLGSCGGGNYFLPINDPSKYKSHNVTVEFVD